MSCDHAVGDNRITKKSAVQAADSSTTISYDSLKATITAKRKQFGALSFTDETRTAVTDFWVNSISHDLFNQWHHTPWDFNGMTTEPRKGNIACGYFVTTILRDMGVQLNRIRLSTCPSSEMMKSLAPGQPLRRLNALSYSAFNDKITEYGKGVYIIGLDFHTGFIVNDGQENWFIHSNYIDRKGVIRETVLHCVALRASRTRWMITLTGDTAFLRKWLRN